MPRRSGTMTVWSFISFAASGAHMSPVSPNPCSRTTAGPLPPTRTYKLVPLVVITCERKPAGNGSTRAMAGDARNCATSPIRKHRIISVPPQKRFETPLRVRSIHVHQLKTQMRTQPSKLPRSNRRALRLLKNWFGGPPRPHGDTIVDRRVSPLELLYDLVYVAVISQAGLDIGEQVLLTRLVNFAFVFSLTWVAWANGSLYLE